MTASKPGLKLRFFSGILQKLVAGLFFIVLLTQPCQSFAQYTVPLRFDVIGDGIQLEPQTVDWDLSTLTELKIGNQVFGDSSFKIVAAPAQEIDLRLNGVSEMLLVAKWPEGLLRLGDLEVLDRAGVVRWKATISTASIKEWKKSLEVWENKNTKGIPTGIFSSLFGIRNFSPKSIPFFKSQESFKFCLHFEETPQLFTRLCSPFMEVSKKGLAHKFIPFLQNPSAPRVYVNGHESELKGTFIANPKKTLQFYAELPSGASYEFSAIPSELNILDTVLEKNNRIKITGDGARPALGYKEYYIEDPGVLEKIIGAWWAPTIKEDKEFWVSWLSYDDPVLYMPGKGGGIFKQGLKISKIPTEADRLRLESKSPDETYIDGAKIYGKKPQRVKISTDQNELIDRGGNEFRWNFQAKERGQWNKSYLTVDNGQNTFKAYYEMYKAFPRELSVRMSGVAATGGSMIYLGEIAFNYWFEDVAGWNNYYLARHRWGFSYKNLRSMNKFKLGDYEETMYTTTMDIKYRFSPGVWGRDETWGLMVGTNSYTYTVFNTNLMGYGLFWARSMPKVFDDILNVVPLFRYPKWVDLEYIYYASKWGVDDRVTLNNPPSGAGNWALNFHGKILWSDRFFGEAGFGIRQLDFTQKIESATVTKQRMQFTSFFGTVGCGVSF